MIRILLSGCCGKMGQAVAAAVQNRSGCEIAAGVDAQARQMPFPVFSSVKDCTVPCDVLIDFSHPSLTQDLLAFITENHMPAVLCTTGLSEEQIAAIREASRQVPIFFSANMSLGVNLMVALAKQAAALLGEDFDVEIIEKHHNQKVDAPSGTALMLVDAVSQELPYQAHVVYDRHSVRQKRDRREVGIHSVRGGNIVGEHEILFAGTDEVLSISHHASSKAVFAVGAVNAAVYLAGQQPGMYDMSRMLADQKKA